MQKLIIWAHAVPGAIPAWRFHDPRSPGSAHTGVDLQVGKGTPVRAMADGILRMHTAPADFMGYGNGYGRVIEIEHKEDKMWSYYAHLGSFEKGLRNGMKLKKGDIVGYSSQMYPHEMITPVRRDRRRVIDPIPFVRNRSESTIRARQIRVQKERKEQTGTVYGPYRRDLMVRKLTYTDFSWADYKKLLRNSAAGKAWRRKHPNV